jgi:hypothetical protein
MLDPSNEGSFNMLATGRCWTQKLSNIWVFPVEKYFPYVLLEKVEHILVTLPHCMLAEGMERT